MENENKTILHKHIAEILNEALKDYGCKIFVAKPRIVDIGAGKCVGKVEVYLEFDLDETEV